MRASALTFRRRRTATHHSPTCRPPAAGCARNGGRRRSWRWLVRPGPWLPPRRTSDRGISGATSSRISTKRSTGETNPPDATILRSRAAALPQCRSDRRTCRPRSDHHCAGFLDRNVSSTFHQGAAAASPSVHRCAGGSRWPASRRHQGGGEDEAVIRRGRFGAACRSERGPGRPRCRSPEVQRCGGPDPLLPTHQGGPRARSADPISAHCDHPR